MSGIEISLRENIFLSLEFWKIKSRRWEEGGLKEEKEKKKNICKKGAPSEVFLVSSK